ncbi:DUF2339 domain-containing protein [Atlantibacter sp.]|uniref:DUF2339 domain-containing protein n=1 Tax=Atlantibacter sp. TaxID=1903473 RepID=UPI0028AA778F|nr:DUF2339 domain-containing protein [Atlantibacter sp.]
MDGLLFWAGLILFFVVIVIPIMAVAAWRKSTAALDELMHLRQRVTVLETRLADQASPAPETPEVRRETEVQAAHAFEDDLIARIERHRQKPMAENAPPAPVDETPLPWNGGSKAASVVASPTVPLPVPSASTSEPIQDIPPSQFSGMFSSLVRWFMQGNPLAKLGVLLLFLGLAYLFRYTVERDMFPLELRLMAAAAGSMGLLFFGFKLRHKQPLYGLILQGGATGALYLTVFGAFRLWQMLPMTLAFGLLLLICAASVGLAVLQKALSLAMLASIGGYLAPILLSTGSGNHIALFSFYLLLSVGILAISWWQHWRVLNLLGMAFTFGVAGLWGMNGYRPEIYLSSQFFLTANILLFGVLCVGLSLRAQESKEKIIDGVLLFAPPLLGFGMQYAIARHFEYGPALSALGFGLVYLVLGWLVLRRYPGQGKILVLAALALGGAFTTLAIPLALSARWTSMAWALEGLGILWLGLQQRQLRMSYSGAGLLVLALFSAIFAASLNMPPLTGILVFGVLCATWFAAAMLWRPVDTHLSTGFLYGSIGLWVIAFACVYELVLRPYVNLPVGALLLACISAGCWRFASQRLSWRELGYTQWLLWPTLIVTIFIQAAQEQALLSAGWQGLIWPVAIVCALALLYKDDDPSQAYFSQALHLSLFWMVLSIVGLEIHWFIEDLPWGSDEWQAGIIMASAGSIIMLAHGAIRRNLWPVRVWPALYANIGLLPLIALLFGTVIFSNLLDGVMAGWPWFPLMNPLEIGAGYGLVALWVAARFINAHRPVAYDSVSQFVPLILAGLAFWWANGMLMRILANYGGVAWQFDSLWASRLIQTTFALFWMLIALGVMVKATHSASRKNWMAGAALLGVVIAKLILVDSARGGGLARAIAFIGVAVLVLIVGYFSPLPPKADVNKAESE